jgi:hypothetical protein
MRCAAFKQSDGIDYAVDGFVLNKCARELGSKREFLTGELGIKNNCMLKLGM